ncbi:MAG: twin-arginine translocase TatA/TatE family subunit [Chloroflexi bacterium]|nr:twin-arginine translocase TatA/TatE family subunit [Chloroflexota bacterium]
MNLFGMGPLELVFVLVVALLVLGPNRMVEAARTLGRQVRTLQRAASEIPRLLSLEEPPEAEPPRARPSQGAADSGPDAPQPPDR